MKSSKDVWIGIGMLLIMGILLVHWHRERDQQRFAPRRAHEVRMEP